MEEGFMVGYIYGHVSKSGNQLRIEIGGKREVDQ
jgi:hypothetical protein